MTAILERPAEPVQKKRSNDKLASMALAAPQVNLLPPEVRSARTLTRLKRWLAVVVGLVMLLSVGMVASSVLAQKGAEKELAIQQAETQQLTTEQQKYAEVPLVLSELDRVANAREVGMSTEVLWRSYFAAIAATAPEGVSVETLGVVTATPMAPPTASTDALAATSVGSITFTAKSRTLPDTAAWLDGLGAVTGFADPWFSTATLTEEDGVVQYTVSATVQVDEKAYAQRFLQTEGER